MAPVAVEADALDAHVDLGGGGRREDNGAHHILLELGSLLALMRGKMLLFDLVCQSQSCGIASHTVAWATPLPQAFSRRRRAMAGRCGTRSIRPRRAGVDQKWRIRAAVDAAPCRSRSDGVQRRVEFVLLFEIIQFWRSNHNTNPAQHGKDDKSCEAKDNEVECVGMKLLEIVHPVLWQP